MAGKGTTTISFGGKGTDTYVDVTEPTIISTNMTDAWIVPSATATNTADDHWVEDITVIAGPANNGVGMRIYAKCNKGFAHGTYSIGYVFA